MKALLKRVLGFVLSAAVLLSFPAAEADAVGGKLSKEEIDDCKEIDVKRCSISDLKGIEYFTALNLSKNTDLRELYCSGNSLKALNVSGNKKLERLECTGNPLDKPILGREQIVDEMKY